MLGTSGLFSDLDVDVELDAPIGSMTWYGVGGRADVLLRPKTIEALSSLVKRTRRTRTPLRVLGKGANLLVADEGVDGIVVVLDHAVFKATDFDESHDAAALRVMAGADTSKTLMECVRRGYEGLSHMAGIPSTIGGAVRMNAGGVYGSISDTLREVTTINRAGEVISRPADAIAFTYRHADIQDPIILSATFALEAQDPISLRERVKQIFEFKKSTQPLAEHSAGCAFRNAWDPEIEARVSAGRLIDACGLKGVSVGGATVSRRHANFITVRGGARASDVIQLMELVRSRVYEQVGIELENEVVVWKRGDQGSI